MRHWSKTQAASRLCLLWARRRESCGPGEKAQSTSRGGPSPRSRAQATRPRCARVFGVGPQCRGWAISEVLDSQRRPGRRALPPPGSVDPGPGSKSVRLAPHRGGSPRRHGPYPPQIGAGPRRRPPGESSKELTLSSERPSMVSSRSDELSQIRDRNLLIICVIRSKGSPIPFGINFGPGPLDVAEHHPKRDHLRPHSKRLPTPRMEWSRSRESSHSQRPAASRSVSRRRAFACRSLLRR